MAIPCEVIEQLNLYQMYLTEIWSARIAASKVIVPPSSIADEQFPALPLSAACVFFARCRLRSG
jgi:hypothetical protein